jgi:hypothetical protein
MINTDVWIHVDSLFILSPEDDIIFQVHGAIISFLLCTYLSI